MSADKISGLPPANTDVATEQVSVEAAPSKTVPVPVPMEVTPTGEDASRVIKGEETKTTSGALREPGEADAGDEVGDEKEQNFIRSALGWLRDNVAKNPWIRGAVAVGSFFFPPLMFLSFLFLALDAILILDKIIAGEKLKLSDILGFVGELIAASLNAEALLPLSQAAIAGFHMFERWQDKRARTAAEEAAAKAADTDTIEKQSEEAMRRMKTFADRLDAGEEPGKEDAATVGMAFGTMTAAAAREERLAGADDSDKERVMLKNIMRRLAERLDQLRERTPTWMERQVTGEDNQGDPEPRPALA